MTHGYVQSPQLLPRHEPGVQTRASFRFEGVEQFGATYAGPPEVALAKAMRDLRSRARCGALAAGRWEVVVRGASDGVEVR
jgi:hypothetical protein